MKKLLLVLCAVALVSGIALATEVIGTAKSVQGIVWVQHLDSKIERLTEGMQLLDDEQLFLEKGSAFEAVSAFGAPTVKIVFGDNGYWDADKGTKNPPDPKYAYCRGASYASSY